MGTSRRDFIKKGSLIAVAAAVPATITGVISTKAASREVAVPIGPVGPGSELTKADFAAQLNTEFRIIQARSQAIVKLVDVSDLAHRKGARPGKEGFSLRFSEMNATNLPQGTYNIQHEKLGTFSFLIVPVKSKAGKVNSYEAIVNRLYP